MNKFVLIVIIFTFARYINMNNSLGMLNMKQYKIYEENGEYSYIDDNNDKIRLHFSDELALIHEYKREGDEIYIGLDIWKYIDKNGNVILQPDVYRADAFSEGYAAVLLEENSPGWAYIDKTGKIVLQSQYTYASMFKNGVASVYIGGNDGKWILINKNGEWIKELDEPLNWESVVQGYPIENTTYFD